MELINLDLVSDGAMFIVSYKADIPFARTALESSGLSRREIGLAERMATDTLLSMALNSMRLADGQLKVNDMIVGEA